ncbi:hypothetical protein [Streptomyces sp. MP131-18]|uniref:hypothetical protein n=1 Tax=Streptomyces sp. MP131-18 TaxID=1857892 RepID=UPI0009C4BDDD|nr:hypothetical protein [Streptomyces sp. MP131-18]ONK15509.1 hypothetical protein STBA_63280 [Streptomyces sp. MP131-18]
MKRCLSVAVARAGEGPPPAGAGARPGMTVELTRSSERLHLWARHWSPPFTSPPDCGHGVGAADVHLSAALDPRYGSRWYETADVLRVDRSQPVGRAAEAVGRALSRYPGCLVAVAREDTGGCVVGARDGTRLRAVPDGAHRPALTAADCCAVASLLHCQLVLGRPWSTLGPVALTRNGLLVAGGALRVLLLPLNGPAAGGDTVA